MPLKVRCFVRVDFFHNGPKSYRWSQAMPVRTRFVTLPQAAKTPFYCRWFLLCSLAIQQKATTFTCCKTSTPTITNKVNLTIFCAKWFPRKNGLIWYFAEVICRNIQQICSAFVLQVGIVVSLSDKIKVQCFIRCFVQRLPSTSTTCRIATVIFYWSYSVWNSHSSTPLVIMILELFVLIQLCGRSHLWHLKMCENITHTTSDSKFSFQSRCKASRLSWKFFIWRGASRMFSHASACQKCIMKNCNGIKHASTRSFTPGKGVLPSTFRQNRANLPFRTEKGRETWVWFPANAVFCCAQIQTPATPGRTEREVVTILSPQVTHAFSNLINFLILPQGNKVEIHLLPPIILIWCFYFKLESELCRAQLPLSCVFIAGRSFN